jgi:hypothetical protein
MFEDRKLKSRVMTSDITNRGLLNSLIASESNDRNMAATRNVGSVSV